MTQLRRCGLAVDCEHVPALRADFQARHCIRLPGLLAADLLDFLGHRLEKGPWSERVHRNIGVEQALEDRPALTLLHFLTNAPEFRQLVQTITNCSPLTIFGGRVYRMSPNAGHHDLWHNDKSNGRLIGMSLNLSPRGYQGGLFQLREQSSGRILTEVANTGFGDAIIFRISSELQHRVTDIEEGEPKTAFAGWFRNTQEDFFSQLRAQSANTFESRP